jgi:large subunit ribosomal protein L18
MGEKSILKNKKAERRRGRVRGVVFGTPERPRLTVFKSLRNVFVQIVDDENRVTLVGLASNSEAVAKELKALNKTEQAKKVGTKLAELAKAKGIESVVFDRNRFRFHGRIKALADGARDAGLKF